MTESYRPFPSDGVSRADIDVERDVEIHDIGALITIVIATRTADPLVMRIVDEFPDDASVIDARFVPEFEPNQGSIDDTGAIYEIAVPTDQPTIVKYGVRLKEPAVASQFTPPTIDLAHPIDEITEDVTLRGAGPESLETDGEYDGEPDEDAEPADAEDESWGEAETMEAEYGGDPSMDWGDEPEPAEDEDETETEYGGDPATDWGTEPDPDPDPEEEDESPDSTSWDTEPASSTPDRPDSVLDELIAELRAGNLTDEQQRLLREELQVAHPESVDVRLRYVQSQVNQLSAFAETVETFIDEHGTLEAFAESIDERQATLEETIEDVESRMADGEQERERIDSRIDAAETTIDGIDEDFEDLRSHVNTEVQAVRDHVDTTVDDFRESITNELEELEESVKENSTIGSQFTEFVEMVESLDLDEAEEDFDVSVGEDESADTGEADTGWEDDAASGWDDDEDADWDDDDDDGWEDPDTE